MKLKEFNDAIATACNVRSNVVSAIQAETFKQVLAAIEKGEKVVVPEFGIFLGREVPGEDGAPATKTVRFKQKTGGGKGGKAGKAGKGGKGGGKGGKAKRAEAKPEGISDDDE